VVPKDFLQLRKTAIEANAEEDTLVGRPPAAANDQVLGGRGRTHEPPLLHSDQATPPPEPEAQGDTGMSGFPIPANEKERLRELRRLRFEEWGARAALDELCSVAASVLETPIAHLSLVDHDEQIFAGKVGLNADRTARAIAFCAHTIMNSGALVIEDAARDPRFRGNPLVTDNPKIGAYLGIPLETSPGLRIGTLCAVDKKPRAFAERDIQNLTRLAGIAVSVLKSYRAMLNLDGQLSSAIALQTEMLPGEERIGQIQAASPLEVVSTYRALDGVGGDIWGLEATGPQRLLLYVADFTGHGLAAALNTARFHSFVHIASQRTDKPASVLRRLSQRLNEVLPVGQFATMFCATLDFQMQTLEYASAGAPPQLYRRSSAGCFQLLARPALPLGVMSNVVYESETLPFEPGGALVLYSDALIETPKQPYPVLTPEGLQRLLNAAPTGSATEMQERIMRALLIEPAIELDDDLTLVVARHTGERMDFFLDYEI
jgi:sigma-B regulation protein RsbU (phosphoserine phosphatase)